MDAKRIAVIGGGFTGLAAGCYARMNGYEVDIFEQHATAGGLCTAWERQGYTFDGCVTWLVGSKVGTEFGDIWQELGVLHGQQFFDAEIYMVVEGLGGERFTAYADPEKLRAEMKRLGPLDTVLIDEFCDTVVACSGLPMSSPEIPARLAEWAPISIQEFSRRFRSPFLGWAFKATFDHKDFPLLFVIFTYACLADHNAGYPLGGSLRLTEALVRRAVSLGCRLHLGQRVEKVLVEGDRAVGVRLAGGEEHRADHVIGAGDLHSLLHDLLDGTRTTDDYRRYFASVPVTSRLLVNFGVRRTFEDVPAIGSYFIQALPAPVWIGGREQKTLWYRVFNFDPTMAPAGSTVVACLLDTDYAYWQALRHDRQAYQAAKDDVATACAVLLERLYPGFREQVEAVDVATPLTFERYTANWQGAIEGWEMTRETMGVQLPRSLPGLDGLYLAGQWLCPGGGLPTAALQGRTIIQAICARDGRQFVAEQP